MQLKIMSRLTNSTGRRKIITASVPLMHGAAEIMAYGTAVKFIG